MVNAKKYIEDAIQKINKMPDPKPREVKTQKKILDERKPVSIEGSDRDPRHRQITNYVGTDEQSQAQAIKGIKQLKIFKKLYGEA